MSSTGSNERVYVVVAVLVVVATATVAWQYTAENRVNDTTVPLEVDCHYDAGTEAVTLEVQRGTVTEPKHSGLWVYVDDELATLSGPDGTTDTGAWVIDGNVSDVANYPIERGSTVTVENVSADTGVFVTFAQEGFEANVLTADFPVVGEDCPTT